MNYKEMDWKAWLAVIITVIIVSGIASGLMAHAEEAASTDLPVVNDEESYWLDEVEGEVILDAPAYFMDVEEEEPADAEVAEVPSSDEPVEESTEKPVTDEPSAPDSDEGKDNPNDDEPVTDPTETPDTPMDEPTTEPTTVPTDTPTEQPAETPEQPEETEQSPVDLKTLFDVSIKVPSGWRNSYSATVRIKITPASDQMWHKVRYRIGDEEWETIPDKDFVLYDGYYYTDIEVYYNAKMSVRLFGDDETYFDTNKEISIFDHYAPEVTAGFRDLVLHVEAVDELSEVAGIQVNSLLFTTLVDGVLDVRMEEPLLGYKQLAIRAYDYAGNFSDPVTLDNPYYVEPTPEPTNTPKPTAKPTKKPSTTKKPTSGSSTAKPTATPVATATPVVTTALQQQIVYVTPDPNMYSYYYQPQVTAEPETVYVPLGPGQPYKSEGNMQTLDMLYSASTNKQFITVQTRAGETYYMVIDYDKPIDEENEIYETYFLNLVDDRDLMSVVSEDEIQPTPTPQIVYVTPEPTEVPVQPTPIPVEDDEPAAPSSATLLLIVGIAAIAGAAFWFVKGKKNNAAPSMDDYEDEYEFEDEEDESDA